MSQVVIGSRPVGRVVLGTASWALHDDPLDEAAAVRVVLAAIENGVTMIDTALVYATATERSYAEHLVAAALRRLDAEELVLVATKGGHYRRNGAFPVDGRPEAIRRHCEQSLRALGVDRIGLYQLHKPDPGLPIEETMGAFAELRNEGKIELVGLSNVSIVELDRAREIVDIASVQNRLELSGRDQMVERCETLGIAFLSYAPLTRSKPGERCVMTAAEAHEVSPAQIVLARHLAAGPNVAVVVGARRSETIRDSARAASLRLSPAERARLESG
jgi:aryl-alcohol dehydrogenase-like predicted oxidoreductase